jgi:hypothetical protein
LLVDASPPLAQRILETPFGPILLDDDRAGPRMSSDPTRLEMLAVELGVDAGELRDHLRVAIAVAAMDRDGNGNYSPDSSFPPPCSSRRCGRL